MAKKWILSVALAGVLIGFYQLSKNSPAVVQTASDEYILSKGVEVENDFQYSANDIWCGRMKSLEGLARAVSAESITSETVSDLRAVARSDQDSRIRELASSMVGSYEENRDFSAVEVYQQ